GARRPRCLEGGGPPAGPRPPGGAPAGRWVDGDPANQLVGAPPGRPALAGLARPAATNHSGTAAASAIGSSRCQMTWGRCRKNSSRVITYGIDLTPIAAAVSCARSISL